MTVQFSSYEGKQAATRVYRNVVCVWLEGLTWYVRIVSKSGKVGLIELSLDDFCIDYAHE